MLRADLVISELSARNADPTGRFHVSSDWFEIHNRGTARIDLVDEYATDDLENLTKWRFPITTPIGPDKRLVIFASGDDLAVSSQLLHTNFQLDGDGENLARVAPDGTIVTSIEGGFPRQVANTSSGISENIRTTMFIGTEATASLLVPMDESWGSTWTGNDNTFDDTNWISGPVRAGYETAGIGKTISPPLAHWMFENPLCGSKITTDE